MKWIRSDNLWRTEEEKIVYSRTTSFDDGLYKEKYSFGSKSCSFCSNLYTAAPEGTTEMTGRAAQDVLGATALSACPTLSVEGSRAFQSH